MLRFVFALTLTLLTATPAVAASPDLTIDNEQHVAAWTGVGFGIGTQAVTLTTAVLWATGASPEGTFALIPLSMTNAPMSVAGIAGFEGVLRDGTLAGYRQGLGTGFLEGGIYSMGMAGLIALGQARHDGVGLATAGTDPVMEDVSALWIIPMIITYASLGGVYTGVGAGLLSSVNHAAGPPPTVAIRPTFSASPSGMQAGIAGVFPVRSAR